MNSMNLSSYKKLSGLIIIVFFCSISSYAQYNIIGATTANLGETKNYSFEDNNGYSPYSQYSFFYEWYADGIITASNDYYYGDYNEPNISVQWTYPGFNYISVDVYDDYFIDYYYDDIEVDVIGTLPENPGDPTSNNDVCNPIITRNGTPQNGDIWYWQGKDANGTSTTKGSGTLYYPNEGSGTYYIRAKATNGIWSSSASIDVSVVSPTLWYTDTDNDGFGDPASTPISSCTKPSGRVSNNFDECPTVSGNLLNNGCSGNGDLGSTDKNYVHTITPLIAVSNVSQITNEDDKLESVTYYDGLGRGIQSVGIRAGGQKQDIKSPMVYDEFGRQARTYLPHASVTSSVSTYTSNASLISDIETYYLAKYPNQLNNSNPNPYAEKRFDTSPLSRALESGVPGEDWLINPNSDADHTTKYEYGTNATDEVYKIDYPGAGQSLSISNYYTEGLLIKNTVKNQNWIPADGKVNTKDVFTDKSGKKIAEFSYIIESSVLKTLKNYYVYDNTGNLVYVLTPKLFTIISGSTISVTNLNNLAFQYKYDTYNRQIEQKVPGKKQWEYMVYDELDRPILTQDENLKDDGKWLFTKYDAFGRAVYSGLFTSALTRDQLQTAVNSYISANTNNLSNIESRTSASSIGGVTINYSNNAYPTTNLEVLTVNYYDDYSFTDANKPTTPTSILGQTVTTRTKGFSTASWTKTLGSSSWAKSYSYYNEKGSVIYVYEKNYLGGYTENKSKLDFRGKVTASVTEHKRTSSDTPLVIKDYFTYDHVERPLSHTQSIGGNSNVVEEAMITLDDLSPTADETINHVASESITLLPGFTALPGFHASIESFQERELIGLHTYDELGKITSKKIGGQVDAIITNSTGLQTVDYTYDIRGALKGVNDVDNIGNDLFAYELNYESGEGTNFNAPQYNGNISQMVWKSAHNNTKKSYYYDYDDLNRFKNGRYGEGSSLTSNWTKFEVNVNGYDHNGNITGLTRKGGASGSTIDNLTYYYDTGNGNQLMKIVDASGTDGFTNGTTGSNEDYAYDDNGNLTKDLNKNISLIEYNHLDLVTKVTFINGSKIEFVYDASGAKLEMKYTPNGASSTTTHYIGGFQYQNNILQFFPTPEGYVETSALPSGELEGAYIYTLKDHLGNNRVAFKDVGGDNTVNSTDILSSTDYYPMGLIHYSEYVANSNYNYKYQNKEQLLANGYNMYDFGSRMYDASVGRWFNIDPQNQFWSPYLAMGNVWVVSVDPNGEWVHIAIGFLVGGVINTVTNWDNISNGGGSFWDKVGRGATYFGIGGVSGAVTAATGNLAAGGAILAGGNSAYNQYSQTGSVNLHQLVGDTFVGAGTAYLGGQFAPVVSKFTSPLFTNANSLASKYLSDALTNTITGVTLSTAMGVANGQSIGDAFQSGIDNIPQSLAISAIGTTGSTLYKGYVDKKTKEEMLVKQANDPDLQRNMSSKNAALLKELNKELSFAEKKSLFNSDGSMKSEIILKSKMLKNGLNLDNDVLKSKLLDTGGELSGWWKMGYSTGGMKGIDVHYYYNFEIQKAYYGLDYKAILGKNYLQQTPPPKQ